MESEREQLTQELYETLVNQVLQQLDGGRAKTDFELVGELAITPEMIHRTMEKLVEQNIVEVASDDEAPEIIYTLQRKPSFVDKLRQAGW